MNEKTIMLIGGGLIAYMLLAKSNQARAAQIAGQQRNNKTAGLLTTAAGAAGVLGKFFSGFTAGASQPWGGSVPSVATARAAAAASNADSNPDLNGSIGDLIFNDGVVINPPGVSSVYDYINEYSYGY